MNHREFFEETLLPLLEKPSRYLGTELNSVHKDPADIKVRVALVFPDLYDIGLGNLSIQILYHILNQQPDVWAERAYAPGIDLEHLMREHRVPLLSLESRTPLAEFDALGFTLQSELTYTNILNMLDLSQIPIHREERRDKHPIILAGGPCAFNPEPLVDFIDAFVIGDGEDVVAEIAEIFRQTQGMPRAEKLARFVALKGVYVPAHYPDFVPLPDGTLVPPAEAPRITKRNVASLEATPFPKDYIVPFTRQIHDRVSLEVLRGCTQSCRFCQAGMVTRPVRERNLDTLDELMQQTLEKTGYEEVSLVSLSTCDYSRVKSLVQRSVQRAIPQRIGVSLPSLRLDSFSVELAGMVSVFKKSGITFAPEAATDRLRSVINKFIPDEELLQMTEECYRRGWVVTKLYFMMGLPTEQDEDVLAIADLIRRVAERGRAVNRRARIKLSVSTFVPKPHTPFQWDAQMTMAETDRKQALLQSHLPRRADWSRHNSRESLIEGTISRGDRRVGKLIQKAWSLGCKFDAWREHLNWEAWQEAFESWEQWTGKPIEHMLRARDLDEPLPWDHIDILVSKEWLKADYRLSRQFVWHGDCRHAKCDQCGVIDREQQQCLTMLRRSHKDSRQDQGLEWEVPAYEEPVPAQRLRFRYTKLGASRYLSGIETVNALHRALRRAGVAMSYSQGFEPQPKLSFIGSLPTGYESEAEYADLLLRESMAPDMFREALSQALPEGMCVVAAWEISLRDPSLSQRFRGAAYELGFPKTRLEGSLADLLGRLDSYLAADEIQVLRRRKRHKVWRQVDIRPAIELFKCTDETPESLLFCLQLQERGDATTKVSEVLGSFLGEEDPLLPYVRVRKLHILGLEESPMSAR